MHDTRPVTQLLSAVRHGEKDAMEKLLPLVYDELRAAAHRQLARRRNQTLDTTALAHEAYLKLIDQTSADWRDRGHFLAVAALAMRHILVDAARRRAAKKRGGEHLKVTYEEADLGNDGGSALEILALDQALEALAELNERLAKLVELRFFGGLTVEETAEVMEISERTVKRDWRKARAFLYKTLNERAAAG